MSSIIKRTMSIMIASTQINNSSNNMNIISRIISIISNSSMTISNTIRIKITTKMEVTTNNKIIMEMIIEQINVLEGEY